MREAVANLAQKLIILVIVVCLSIPMTRQSALAGAADQRFNLAVFALGTFGASNIAYYVWKNRPAARAKGYPEKLGPGEWFLAAYTGFSHLPKVDWELSGGVLNGRTAHNVAYQPAVVGGIKFGRYYDSLPWFGWEMETNFSRHAIRAQGVRVTPAMPGGNMLNLPRDRFYIWTMQLNLLARYGFFKDKEIPFGRLQPYIGVGPGFEIIYGESDSAKNFVVQAQAGIRYMCTAAVALFCEYKFSYQSGTEIEQKIIIPPDQTKLTFDVPHQRIVVGVSYHFKNLFGN